MFKYIDVHGFACVLHYIEFDLIVLHVYAFHIYLCCPNETWAPEYVSELMPQFKDKITGMAMNVPVANGSCVDLTTEMNTMPSIDEVNEAFRIASENELKDLIGYTEDPIVSSDAIGSGNTMVFDTKATMIASNKLLKT